MKTIHQSALLLLLTFSLLFPTQCTQAQSSIRIGQNLARLDFPASVTFDLTAYSDSPITEAVLTYGTSGRSCLDSTARQEPGFTHVKHVNITWTWDFNRTESLPPGAEIWWQWQLHNEQGDSFTTDRKTLLIEDDSQTWKSVQGSGVEVFWFKGSDAFGRMVLEQAVHSLERLSEEAGLATTGNVRLNIYASAEQVRQAALKLPEWAAGVAYPEYGSILLGLAPGDDDWSKRSIAHELAHLVTGERIFNCYDNLLPTWLEEGLAVYAEGELPASRVAAVETALKAGSLPELRTLAAGFAASSQLADLEYSQSGVMVGYMLEMYGPEKMATLLSAVQSGRPADKALQQVYGLDTNSLDQAWRVAQGYATLAPAEAAPGGTAGAPTPIATLALWTPVFAGKKTTTPPPPTPTPAAETQVSATQPPIAESRPSARFPLWLAAFPALLIAGGVSFWLARRKTDPLH